ncbi:MAG TPA: TlpA disulfide reductase family protein, partial [Vulgatibacter sp.]
VIRDHSFTADDGSTFKMSDVFADEKNRVMLLSTSADWCTACKEEAPKLEALHREFSGKGLVVVVAMFEDGDFEAATLENVRNWKKKYDVSHSVVLDAEFQLSAYYDRKQTPMNMIVDVDTMTIKYVTTGFNEQAIRALIIDKVGR